MPEHILILFTEIKTEEAGDWNRERFKASINFSWIGDDGNIYPAPNSQLILYPKYPEVRFSGFLARCENPPSELMTQRLADRLLFLSISNKGEILGYVTSPNSELAKEFNALHAYNEIGIFKVIDLPRTVNNKAKLLDELYRIHQLNWIISKRLDKNGNILQCVSSNCGGYTLEAELGIKFKEMAIYMIGTFLTMMFAKVIAGFVADRIGRRIVFAFGTSIPDSIIAVAIKTSNSCLIN